MENGSHVLGQNIVAVECVLKSLLSFLEDRNKEMGYTEEPGQNVVKAHTFSNPLLTKAPSTYHYFPTASSLIVTMCENGPQDTQ